MLSILHMVLTKLLISYNILQIHENTTSVMVWKVDERIPEEMFVNLMTEKANIIKDHLKNSLNQQIIVANIGPTMATFKFYDLEEKDSLKLCITLSNLGDIDEQFHQLWQQVNFLLQQYCSKCQCHYTNANKTTDIE